MEDKEVMPDLNAKQREVVSWFRVVMGADSLGVYTDSLCIKRSYEWGKFDHVWYMKTNTNTLKALVNKGYLEIVPSDMTITQSTNWRGYRLSLKGLAVPYDNKHPALVEFQTKITAWRKTR